MSGSCARRLRRVVLAAVLFHGFIAAGAARALADEFDRARAQQEVAAQKAFEEVKTTLTEARRLERTRPAEAVRLLKKCLASVEDDTVLTEPQRTALARQLRSAVRDMDEVVRAQQDRDAKAARLAAEKRQREPRGPDQGRSNPASTASTAKELHDAARNRVTDAAKVKAAKEAGNIAAARGNEEAAIPTDQAMVFASSYAYRAALRGKQQLTDKEKSLLKALNSVMSVDYNKMSFRDVIDDLIERTGQAIILDQDSLKEAMVEYDDPVTFKAKKVTVRTILKKVLADRGLTYVLKEGSIQVLTPQKARETVVARSYPVGDLATSLDMRFPPLLRRLQMLQNVAQLIELIQNSIDPSSWQASGGSGTISFYEPTMSLVIRQTAEMHYQLGGALSR